RVRENRTHGSTGGDWKRNATASPRQPPTQPTSSVSSGTAMAKAKTLNDFLDKRAMMPHVSIENGPRLTRRNRRNDPAEQASPPHVLHPGRLHNHVYDAEWGPRYFVADIEDSLARTRDNDRVRRSQMYPVLGRIAVEL